MPRIRKVWWLLAAAMGCIFLIVCNAAVMNAQTNVQPEISAPASQADDSCAKEPFTYDNGPLGQPHWCGSCNLPESKLQAPININPADTEPQDLPGIDFSGYKTTKLVVSENVHNLKVNYKEGQSSIAIGNEKFKLVEFHFHRPSEEAINNRRPAMVIHLVHANSDQGPYYVISVLVEEGTPSPKTALVLNQLIRHFPPPYGAQGGPQGVDINAADLLPAGNFPVSHSYFRYQGSLTTPACGENVTFYVLKTPVRFSAEQISQFARRYPFPNARNIQNTNGRTVVQTRR